MHRRPAGRRGGRTFGRLLACTCSFAFILLAPQVALAGSSDSAETVVATTSAAGLAALGQPTVEGTAKRWGGRAV